MPRLVFGRGPYEPWIEEILPCRPFDENWKEVMYSAVSLGRSV